MGALIQLLSTTSAGTVLAWIIAIVAAAACVYSWAQKYRKIKNKYEDTQIQTKKNAEDISLLRNETHQLAQMFLDEVCRLDKNDTVINKQLNDISAAIDSLDKYNKSKDMSVLKDRIYRNFRSYKKRAKYNKGIVFVTQNELEAFSGLIDSYVAAGGNSFVHNEIRPAMLEWEVISEEEVTHRLGEEK